MKIKDLLVLGSGSAGLLAALAVKRKMPEVNVRVVRSRDIGIVGVGESTTPNVRAFLFEYLGIDRRAFFKMAEPTWKLGIHFLWGPRAEYFYPFVWQLDARVSGMQKPLGFYCEQDFSALSVHTALMAEGKAFPRSKHGTPEMDNAHAFHLENAKFVKTLEAVAVFAGVEFIEGTLKSVERCLQGVAALILEDGQRLSADFYLDTSGFRSELIGKAFEEPFISYEKSLFNDRAILGSWERNPDEPILPHTTAETMNSGWAWRIDHERVINRGYVFSSHDISEEDARREFAAKNPRAKLNDRLVRFRTGRHQRSWVGNVMAIGNSYGFVEPLEATALMLICWQCQSFVDLVQQLGAIPPVRDLMNTMCARHWDETRDFLTIHFSTNTRLNTPYWLRCREEADTSSFDSLIKFYKEAGPTGFARYYMSNPDSHFRVEGYLVQLVGNQVPHSNRYSPTDAELSRVQQLRVDNRMIARQGFTVAQSLAFIRHPEWRWFSELPAGTPAVPHQPAMAK